MALVEFPIGEERALTIQDLAKMKYEWISLVRTSTTEQKKSIDQQEEEVARRMKFLGFGNPIFIEKSNVSGAKEDRKQMDEIFEFIENYPEPRNLILVVRDAARFSRNQRNAFNDQARLEALGVYLYFSNSNTLVGGKTIDQGSQRATFSVELLLANFGKFDENIASQRGRRKAKENKGIAGGTARDTFREIIPKSGKQKGKSIFRRVAESLGALDAGTLSVKGLARELSNSQRLIYPAIVRRIRDEVREVKAKVGEDGLAVWLDVWDALIEQEKNPRVGRLSKPPRPTKGKKATATRQTERARAIWRVAQGYIANPEKFKDPVNIGNPETATFPSAANVGTIAHASKNPLQYLPQAR